MAELTEMERAQIRRINADASIAEIKLEKEKLSLKRYEDVAQLRGAYDLMGEIERRFAPAPSQRDEDAVTYRCLRGTFADIKSEVWNRLKMAHMGLER
ncbi:MAG TPA: hypothetical protein VFH17_08325 [Coriobacteriia bacterium]|nr:hypothetical protein [Coriobacteriia bacterium]